MFTGGPGDKPSGIAALPERVNATDRSLGNPFNATDSTVFVPMDKEKTFVASAQTLAKDARKKAFTSLLAGIDLGNKDDEDFINRNLNKK